MLSTNVLPAIVLSYVLGPAKVMHASHAGLTARMALEQPSDEDSKDAGGLDMSLLASRISALQQAPEPEKVRLFNFDAMVPGQCLTFSVPASFVETLDRMEVDECPLVMVGRDRLRLLNNGVECRVERLDRLPEGDAIATLIADRYCEVVEVGEDEGSRWLGRSGSVRWLSLDASTPGEQPAPAVLSRAKALDVLVSEWMQLVKATGRERQPGQIEKILADLGPIPEPNRPTARALWIAGLINPLPALGVALEIRPACLTAETADIRLQVVEMGLKDSIERLKRPGPTF